MAEERTEDMAPDTDAAPKSDAEAPETDAPEVPETDAPDAPGAPEPEKAAPEKEILNCPNGRMVILEHTGPDEASTSAVAALARDGKDEGFARYAALPSNQVNSMDAPGLFLCILVRPGIHAKKAGQLSAIAAVAVARAVEKISPIDVRIRWVNDLYHGSRRIAAMMTAAQIKPNGFLDYAAIGISLCLAPDDFPPKLGDVIRQVFENGETRDLPPRLAEAILFEFFNIYDVMMTDNSYMEEYRRRSLSIGRSVRILTAPSMRSGRVVDIDNNACLVVELRDGRRVTIASRSEISF